jgi:adenylosuccinate synthase
MLSTLRAPTVHARAPTVHGPPARGPTYGITVILGEAFGDEGKGKLVDDLAKKHDIVCRFAGGSNAGHTIVVDGVTYKFHLLPSGMIHLHVTCVIGNGVVLNIPALFKEIEEIAKNLVKQLKISERSQETIEQQIKETIEDILKRLKISDRCHLVFGFHKIIDGLKEKERGDNKIGSTLQGIGPCYTAKAARHGVRAGLLLEWEEFVKAYHFALKEEKRRYETHPEITGYDFQKELDELQEFAAIMKKNNMIINTMKYLHTAYTTGKKIMAEGANATMIDLDFGTYPFVTSSSCTIGGVLTGLGVNAGMIGEVIGIMKAYTTRVGSGGFPTELTDETGTFLQIKGNEKGTTTGRPRRCGWMDIVVAKYANELNGFTFMNLTKLDVPSGLKEINICVEYLDPVTGTTYDTIPDSSTIFARLVPVYETLPGWEEDISACRRYEDLPQACKNYISRLERLLGVPIKYIGVGADREATIVKEIVHDD